VEKKLKILFLSLVAIDDIEDRNIYADLMRCFVNNGHYVSIYTPIERRNRSSINIKNGKNYKITRVRSLNIQKTNLIEKALGTFSLDFIMKRALIKGEYNSEFDLLMFSTPPITLTSTIKWAKNKFHCISYLLLKDIFPQNAVDIGLIRDKGIIYRYFKQKESSLYKLSDYIGCMSERNVEYVLSKNDYLQPSKVELCPNSIEFFETTNDIQKDKLRKEFGIPEHARVFIYGGNLGKPQGVDFLMQVLSRFDSDTKVFFIIIGSGTEYDRLYIWYLKSGITNIIIKEHLPKEQYDLYVRLSDVGLIFLDFRFTIPNYPSRLLSYMEFCKPVLVFSDLSTDVGNNCEARGYGKWSSSDDINKASDLINDFCTVSDSELRVMGQKGFEFLKNNYSVQNTYQVIMNHF